MGGIFGLWAIVSFIPVVALIVGVNRIHNFYSHVF